MWKRLICLIYGHEFFSRRAMREKVMKGGVCHTCSRCGTKKAPWELI